MPDIFVKPKPMFPLAEFALDPAGVHFATQGEEEKIHLFLRRHFVTNIPWILFIVFLSVLPAVAAPFIDIILPTTFLSSVNWAVVALLFYYIVVFGLVIVNFINWYFNVYIVTNQRVVDVDFYNIIYREVSSTRLNLIQDITVKTGGVLKAVFDYGHVFIQTAGTEVNFDFHDVPHPQRVAREIEALMEKSRNKDGLGDLERSLKEA